MLGDVFGSDLKKPQVRQELVDCAKFFIAHSSNRLPRHLLAEFMPVGIDAGSHRTAGAQCICDIQPTPSTAAANIELAINRGVLLIDMFEIAGVFRWNVTRMRLPVADRRVAHQSRVLRQR